MGTVRNDIEHPGWVETHLTIPGCVGRGRLQSELAMLPYGAQVIFADLFGAPGEIAVMQDAMSSSGVSLQSTSVISSAAGMGGMQLVAASGERVSPVSVDGIPAGFLVEDDFVRRFHAGGITPPDATLPREAQAGAVFALAEGALAGAAMTFNDVARTWFYNADILDWYAGFNGVRREYFRRHGIRRMPASTGIGACNTAGSALVAKLMAVQSRRPGDTGFEIVASPLQCDAFSYGSAFSRAVMIRDVRSRTLHVSGTASIAPDGKSACLGDVAAQIDLTMRVVDGILGEAGFTLADTVRGIAYFRDPSDTSLWAGYLRSRNLENMPAVALGCHVCRDDLLFEIELELSARL